MEKVLVHRVNDTVASIAFEDACEVTIGRILLSTKAPEETIEYELQWNQFLAGFKISNDTQQRMSAFEPIVIEFQLATDGSVEELKTVEVKGSLKF